MHLPFQQSQIELAHTVFSPEVCTQTNFSQLVAFEVESNTLDGPSTEVKPCDHSRLWQLGISKELLKCRQCTAPSVATDSFRKLWNLGTSSPKSFLSFQMAPAQGTGQKMLARFPAGPWKELLPTRRADEHGITITQKPVRCRHQCMAVRSPESPRWHQRME